MSLISQINQLNSAALRFLDYGHCPYLSIPRLTSSTPLIRLCNGRPKFISLCTYFIYFSFIASRSLLIQLIGSLYVSILRTVQPTDIKRIFPFLFSPYRLSTRNITDNIVLEPFLGQSLSSYYHFKSLFNYFYVHHTSHSRIFLVDSPFKIPFLQLQRLSNHHYFPFFLGFSEFLSALFAQLFFSFRLTTFLVFRIPSLLPLWLALLPSVFTNWSFSLFSIKNIRSIFLLQEENLPINIHLLHEGFTRDLLFYKHLSGFPHLFFNFYSHIPLLSSSNTLISSIIYNSRVSYFFEDPLATSSNFYKDLEVISDFHSSSTSRPYLDIACHHFSVKSTKFIFNHSALSSLSLSLSSFVDNSSAQEFLPFVILPQGFLSETYLMIDLYLNVISENPSLALIFKPYISIHPALRNNMKLDRYVRSNSISFLRGSNSLSSLYKIVLCGESTSGYSYLDRLSLPVAFKCGVFSDSIFSRLTLSSFQTVTSSSDLTNLLSLFAK